MLDGAEEYREPFVGAGSIAVAVAGLYPRISVWLNDGDPAIASLWTATRNVHTKVSKQVLDFLKPSVAAFDLFGRLIEARAEMPRDADARARLGFYYLAWSHMRARGWGQGPRGGWDQRIPLIGERWNPQYISDKLTAISDRLGGADRTKITCCDFEPLITDTSRRATLFLDPPYFGKGSLYRYDMDEDDHYRLARLLRSTSHNWLLTYEDHPMVRELYDPCWASIRPLYEGRRCYANPMARKVEKKMTLAITNRRGTTGEPPRASDMEVREQGVEASPRAGRTQRGGDPTGEVGSPHLPSGIDRVGERERPDEQNYLQLARWIVGGYLRHDQVASAEGDADERRHQRKMQLT
jgi:DNA adenine methylase